VHNNESIQTSILNIQPNPLSTKTIISFDNPDNDIYTFRIIDINGKLIKKMDNIHGNFLELSRSNLPSGIYYVELSGKTSRHGKLLVE
jgi:hypothetical protein